MVAATQAAPKSSNEKAAPPRKFRAGVQDHDESVITLNATPGTSGTPFTVEVPSYGFLRGLWFYVQVTGGSGAVTPATYDENAPFSWIQSVQLNDVNSAPIIFSITGYDLYLIYKYGGYWFQADPKNSEEYTQGGDDGNSVFVLYMPFEVRARDGLGAMPNTSANTAYKLLLTVAPYTDVYGTAPGTLPTNIRVDIIQDAWWEPQPTDLAGRPQADEPPAPDSTQYWSKVIFSHSSSGAITDQIKRLGYLYRNLILYFQTTAPARSNTVCPDPLTLIYEGQQKTIQNRTLWRHKMARLFGYTAAAEAAGGLDTGVFVWPFNRDFGLQPGAEIGNGYLPTTSGTRVELQGSLGAAGSVTVLVNDVSAVDELEITGS